MLPFLKPKSVAGMIISKRKPDGTQETSHMEGEEDQGLKACMEDLLRALTDKDAEHAALAFRAAFDVLESEPHDEVSHQDDEITGE